MVLGKIGKVVVAAAMDADQRDHIRVDGLQFLAVADGNKPVAGSMNDICMTFHFPDPEIGAQVILQYKTYRKNGKKAVHHFLEAVIRAVQYQVAGMVIRSDLCGKSAADAAPIEDEVILGTLFFECVIHELHIGQHLFFASFAGTFSESPVIHHHHIIIVAVEVAGIFCPAFDAAGIAMEVENNAFGVFPVKMQAVDPYTRFDIEEELFERDIVFELEIGWQPFRFEDEFILYEKSNDAECGNSGDDIPNECRQYSQFTVRYKKSGLLFKIRHRY